VGGVVAQAIAAAAPARVAGVLGVAAVWPAPGRSFAGALPAPSRWVLPTLLRLAGTRPPEKQLRAMIGTAIAPATADRLVTDFSPEARRLFVAPAPTGPLPEHRGYVRTTVDHGVAPAIQSRSARALGGSFERELATGHLPMLEQPAALTAVIADFTRAA
jgi:pimeloyl-ACP methyl ester carboxylesterase